MKNDQKAVREIASDECFCQRCHAPLDTSAVVWLDMNWRTGRYSDEPLPEGESQGCFPFGPACAKAVLAAGGECHEIRDKFVGGCRIPTRRRRVL